MESDNFANLKLQRSDVDAWQTRRGFRVADQRLGLTLASMAGAALVLFGISRRRSTPGMRWLIGGAVLGCAAASLRTAQSRRGVEQTADTVTQESIDSFPASDAPSSNASTASAPLRSDSRVD